MAFAAEASVASHAVPVARAGARAWRPSTHRAESGAPAKTASEDPAKDRTGIY